MSTLAANYIQSLAGKRILNTTGGILQVKQTVKSDTFSTSGTSYVEITGLNVSITPTSTTNKILIDVCLFGGESSDSFPAMRLMRNGSVIILGELIGSGQQATFGSVNTGADTRDQYLLTNTNFKYLDSPNTISPVTYSIQVRPFNASSRTFYLNRPQSIVDGNQYTVVSTITATEIVA